MVSIKDLNPTPHRMGKQIGRPRKQLVDKEELLIEQAAANIEDITTIDDIFETREAKDQGYERLDPRYHQLARSHTRPGRVIMFKIDPQTGRVHRRPVIARNILMNKRAGWLLSCPDCGDPDCSDNPNDCPGRDKKAWTRCPVCSKRFFDPGPASRILDEQQSDEHEVLFEDSGNLTPQDRIKTMRDRHMLVYHESEAIARGLKFPQGR